MSEKFWLSLLGIRGTREEARYGWQTGATDKPGRYLRVAFKEKLPVGTVIGGGGTLSFLKADAPSPGDVTDNSQWETVPLPKGQAGMRVYTFPPGVVTRALRWSFSVSPVPGKPSQSGSAGHSSWPGGCTICRLRPRPSPPLRLEEIRYREKSIKCKTWSQTPACAAI